METILSSAVELASDNIAQTKPKIDDLQELERELLQHF